MEANYDRRAEKEDNSHKIKKEGNSRKSRAFTEFTRWQGNSTSEGTLQRQKKAKIMKKKLARNLRKMKSRIEKRK